MSRSRVAINTVNVLSEIRIDFAVLISGVKKMCREAYELIVLIFVKILIVSR